jgi:spore germination protein KC
MRQRTGRRWWPRLGRAGLALAVALAAAALAGCWGIAAMDRRALVLLLGFDALPGPAVRVTAAILNPLGQPNIQGSTAGGTPEIVRSATAATPSAALARIAGTSYLDLDFRHLKGIVVSSAVAERGLAPLLESLIRAPTLSATPWLYVARGATAAAVLQGSAEAMPNAGAVLEQTAVWSRLLTPTYGSRAYAFAEQMQVTGDDAVTGGIALDPAQRQPDAIAFRVAGVAMFQSDRLAGWLEGPAALGWLVGTGRANRQTLVAPGPGGLAVTLQLVAARRRIRVLATPAGPRVSLSVRVKARVAAVEPGGVSFAQHPAALRQVQDGAAGVLGADVRDAVSAAQRAGADVFGLGEAVRVQDPSAWRALRSDWDASAFPRLPVSVAVQVIVTSVGRSFCQPFGPC